MGHQPAAATRVESSVDEIHRRLQAVEGLVLESQGATERLKQSADRLAQHEMTRVASLERLMIDLVDDLRALRTAAGLDGVSFKTDRMATEHLNS